MLTAEIKPKGYKKDLKNTREQLKPVDIIVEKEESDIITYNTDGGYTVKKAFKKVNVTKLVNETKKLVKTNSAEEKLEELKKAVSEAIR